MEMISLNYFLPVPTKGIDMMPELFETIDHIYSFPFVLFRGL